MEFWHLVGRGVEKRDIVADDKDRARFIHDLYIFNDHNPAPNYILSARHDHERKRKRLIDIHAFALMKNHYHLLVSEIVEQAIPRFMQKFNMGYTKYFNERHGRSGALWQGKYRKVQICQDAHFLYVPYYIHLNPLDYTHPLWREGAVQNKKQALEELECYRWSSHLDYLGIKNVPSIIRQDVLRPFLGTSAEYQQALADIIADPAIAEKSNDFEYKN